MWPMWPVWLMWPMWPVWLTCGPCGSSACKPTTKAMLSRRRHPFSQAARLLALNHRLLMSAFPLSCPAGHVEHVDVQGCSFMQGPGADPVADFDPSSPNGHYCLDLAQPKDYQVGAGSGGCGRMPQCFVIAGMGCVLGSSTGLGYLLVGVAVCEIQCQQAGSLTMLAVWQGCCINNTLADLSSPLPWRSTHVCCLTSDTL